ncbi:DUF6439 family protein [Myxosarcina sp. GI1]|uniref:DUF6439 family protein n=1 Tax=Myxosarcina sp. GI1 TaxID=1541065 RepID=UPI00055B613A|nr:DUF6439 family protein [Myxosarcina sp. GI1]
MSPTTPRSKTDLLAELSEVELAQALASKSAIAHQDWHRLKGNRQAQAKQQLASALVFLIKGQPETALIHLKQALGWLEGSLASPPCPDRQKREKKNS